MAKSRTYLIAYYEGVSGDTKALLVNTDREFTELTPETVGLTTDDGFNSIQLMYEECSCIAWTEGPGCSVFMCDVSVEGREEAAASGYNICEVQEIE